MNTCRATLLTHAGVRGRCARVSSLAWVRAGGADAEEASEVATGAELEDEDDGVSEGVVVEEAHDVGGTTGEVLQGLELAEEVIGDALVRRADHHAFRATGSPVASRRPASTSPKAPPPKRDDERPVLRVFRTGGGPNRGDTSPHPTRRPRPRPRDPGPTSRSCRRRGTRASLPVPTRSKAMVVVCFWSSPSGTGLHRGLKAGMGN